MTHRSHKDMLNQIASASVTAGQSYRHHKTGGVYIVKEIVVLEASDELAVAYYNPDVPELVWARAYDNFTSVVDGQPRFRLLD